MLDPRIYRTGFVAVALAVIVFAFSLQNEQGAMSANLAPSQFSGTAAQTQMLTLAGRYPSRAPGSAADNAVAQNVETALQDAGPKRHTFTVSTQFFSAETSAGTRTLETVTGLLPGLSSGTIAIVAPRDGSGTASLSGTAVLEQLAAVLAAQSLNHSVLLASASGTAGGSGTAELAGQLARDDVDAVIVLGDMAGENTSEPLIVPWSNGRLVAPSALRATLAAAVRTQAALKTGDPGVPAQLARLAFPLTLSPQGPFAADGIPAVTLSVSGERGPTAGEKLYPRSARIAGMGKAVVATIDALDAGPTVPAPSTYISFSGKTVPFWAVRMLVLALLLPVLLVMVDGIARARRRGHTIFGSSAWVLAGAVPFVLGAVVIRLAKLISAIAVAPPGPVGAGIVPLGAGGIAVLVLVALVVVAALLVLRPLCIAAAAGLLGESFERGADDPPVAEGVGPALLLVACVVTLALWAENPFAALLVVPALHLWVWVVDSDLQLPRPVAVAMLVVGLVPPVLVVGYYAHAFGLSLIDAIWNGVLLIAGGQIDLLAALEWSIVLGCLVSAVVIALSARRHQREEPEAITVRGPISYAGPGSLGGDGISASTMTSRTSSGPVTPAPLVLTGSASPLTSGFMRRRLLRDTAWVLIIVGLLLALDAAVTLLWQEPVTAVIALVQRGSIDQQELSIPLTGLDRHALASLTTMQERIAFLARREQRALRTGAAIGRIVIPRIGTSFEVVQGTDAGSLRLGPGHYPGTALPGLGETVAIAGHRTTYLEPFRDINQLVAGDAVILRMPYATFTYVVQSSRVVTPTADWVLDDVGYDRLVLSACTPLYSAAQRIIVFARLQEVRPAAYARAAA